MGRVINFTGGLAMLAGASQFPEFSQQYVQRLGGAVDELRQIAADFDKSANGVGYTRQEALASMTGNEFQLARQADMTGTFARLDRLEGDYLVLQDADAMTRLTHLARLDDRKIAERAWEDFQPAVPLTMDGATFGGIGFLSGFGLLALLGGFMRRARRMFFAGAEA